MSSPVLPNTPKKKNSLYAETVAIHPRSVSGKFRTSKWWLGIGLLLFFHIAPFLRWDRGPGVPSQAILGDIDGGRGYFFFIEIWPQEVYYLTGLLLIAAISLFFMSAVAGRVWCGFLCWQTVYTDLFVEIERRIIGDRSAQMALDRQPWTGGKIAKKAAINALWLIISAACGIGFTLYFGDAFVLLRQIFTLEASVPIYSFILIVGGLCYLLAGFAREQVCFYMCPYSRFQSAMLDEHSLVISYEGWRGEPRAPARKGQSFEGRGHCIDCKLCVTVCPTGIDIREGLQMGCIGCGLCIDACNGMMDKVGLPRGLIRYDSTANIAAREAGQEPSTKVVRPRTLAYTAILAVLIAGLIAALATRPDVRTNVLHERSPLFALMSDGSLRNGYVVKLVNMAHRDRTFVLKITGLPGVSVQVIGGPKGTASQVELPVGAASVGSFQVYVNASQKDLSSEKMPVMFEMTDKETGTVVEAESFFSGPDK